MILTGNDMWLVINRHHKAEWGDGLNFHSRKKEIEGTWISLTLINLFHSYCGGSIYFFLFCFLLKLQISITFEKESYRPLIFSWCLLLWRDHAKTAKLYLSISSAALGVSPSLISPLTFLYNFLSLRFFAHDDAAIIVNVIFAY